MLPKPLGPLERPMAMRRMLIALAAGASLFMAAALVPVHHVAACSCAMGNEKQALAAAVVAFEGVVAAGPHALQGQPRGGFADVSFTFAVEKVIKGGPLPDRLHVATSDNGASCGAGFAVGQRWRVYTDRMEGGPLYSGLCSNNQLLAEGVDIPSAPAGGEQGSPASPPFELLLALGLAGIVTAVSFVAFRRGSRPASGLQ